MAHSAFPASRGNLLLAALPALALARIMPKMSRAVFDMRQGLYLPDTAIDSVYFPETGMISLVSNLADGMRAEVGVIGREGVLGGSVVSGVDTSFIEAMVQIPGAALRMGLADFRREIDANPAFRAVLLRYNETLQAQIMQTAACNGRHPLEQRLARWLLMAQDRAATAQLPLTQELLAMMLGVHRPSVTITAGLLQKSGLIRYAGGRVTILDRTGLEAAACECYATVRRRYAALLGGGDT